MQRRGFILNKRTFFILFILVFILFVRADVISVNPGGDNQLASTPDKYVEGFFSQTNQLPFVSNVFLTATSLENLTTDNLTVSYESNDTDDFGYFLTNITDWRLDGNSIAVLNMPFDKQVSSIETGAVRDYSTYGNNGTLGGGNSSRVPTWTSSGQVGGAYEFDGVDDYIDMSLTSGLNSSIWSVSGWVKYNGSQTYAPFVSWRDHYANGQQVLLEFSNRPIILLGGSHYQYFSATSPTSIYDNNWHHVVFSGTKDSLIGSNSSMYVDGIEQDKDSFNFGAISSESRTLFRIGYGKVTTSDYFFNGTIDEVQIFNRTLSAEQIYQIYQDGLANHQVETIASNETSSGDVWQVAVTPNDGYGDGTTELSNELTIENTPPVVTLLSPSDDNTTTNRTPEFSWSGYDADEDDLTYDIKLIVDGSCVCSDDRNPEASGLSDENYVVTNYLECLIDNGCYYNWSVRAHDGTEYGNWTDYWKINIQASLDIILVNDSINFGTIEADGFKNTTADALPFVIRNDGNCFSNVTVNSTSLWESVGSASEYYKFKVDNKSGEEGSFEWASSSTSWTQMSIDSQVLGFSKLNWSDATDSAEIDIAVSVPPTEGSGEKSSITKFVASLGE